MRATITVTLAAAILATLLGTTAEAQSQAEGIRVRGHWTLSVRNADGTVASRTAFDNALTEAGAATLADLLMGQRLVRQWALILWGKERHDPMFETYSAAVIGSVAPEFAPFQVFHTLTQNLAVRPYPPAPLAPGDCPSYCLELKGTATAVAEGVIESVYTHVASCDDVSSPGCPGTFGAAFSTTEVPDSTPPTYPDGSAMSNGLHIKAGQTVEVTVLISFSAAPHQPPS